MPLFKRLCPHVCHAINDKLIPCLVSLNFSAIDHNPTFPYSIAKPRHRRCSRCEIPAAGTVQTANWPRVGSECQG
jgi:hypothetical protein